MCTNTTLYTLTLLSLLTINSSYTMETRKIDPKFNPFPLFKKLSDIINTNPTTLDDTQQALSDIHTNCADVPSEPKLHIINLENDDARKVFDLIKIEVNTQCNCWAPLTFRLQGLQMIRAFTVPFAK